MPGTLKALSVPGNPIFHLPGTLAPLPVPGRPVPGAEIPHFALGTDLNPRFLDDPDDQRDEIDNQSVENGNHGHFQSAAEHGLADVTERLDGVTDLEKSPVERTDKLLSLCREVVEEPTTRGFRIKLLL